jgi:hypothetical protein
MRRRTKSRRKYIKFSQEFVDSIGMDGVRKMILAYDKGWMGIPRTVRVGIVNDDFCMNMLTAVVIMRKVPRLLAPKVHRKNTITNKKRRRMHYEDSW